MLSLFELRVIPKLRKIGGKVLEYGGKKNTKNESVPSATRTTYYSCNPKADHLRKIGEDEAVRQTMPHALSPSRDCPKQYLEGKGGSLSVLVR